MKFKNVKRITAFVSALLLAASFFSVATSAYSTETDDEGTLIVNVESGAQKSSSFITINEELTGEASGLSLIMCGVNEENAGAMVSAVSSTYSPNGEQAIKYVDYSFVDAEKFNADPGIFNSIPYDRNLCWAGSISNLLWISGWASSLSNPLTGKEFTSEDDVFTYYNSRFTDQGSDSDRGLEFFFQGDYFDLLSDGNHTHICNANDRSQIGSQLESDGLRKDIAAACLTNECSIYDDYTAISDLEAICSGTGEDLLFQISIGGLNYGSSDHSVNAAGIIIDPSSDSIESRYKAILLANSDNDGYPSTLTDEATDAEKEADKASRPNSYTLYPLRLVTLDSGKQCWEIVGYSDFDRYALYDYTSLKYNTEANEAAAKESEGTQNTLSNVDLEVEMVFTTKSENPVSDYPSWAIKDSIATEFESGEAINLNFYLQNRTSLTLDSNYTDATTVPVEYKVVKRSDGEIVCSGVYECKIPIYSCSQNTCFLNLMDGKTEAWPAGTYDVYLNVNPLVNGSRTIKEAYYKNNDLASCTFTIKSGPEETESQSQSETESQSETTIAPTNSTSPSENFHSSSTSTVKTGDDAPWRFWAVAFATAISALAFIIYILRRKKSRH